MDKGKRVLLVFDDEARCDVLWNILKDDYNVCRADSYISAVRAIESYEGSTDLIILSLEKSADANRLFVDKIIGCRTLHDIPIVLSVNDASDKDSINMCLSCGAWDYMLEPHEPEMVRYRIANYINVNRASIYRELKYRKMFDELTGVYNRERFFAETRKVLDDNPDMDFAFIRFDIYKFQLVNQFYGTKEGDRLIKYVAEDIAKDVWDAQMRYGKDGSRVVSFGRIEKDVFCVCVPYTDKDEIAQNFINIRERYSNYGLDFVILPVFGVYLVNDRSISVNEMYDRANMATKSCKDNFMTSYAFYDDKMGRALIDEQMIVNEMSHALSDEQFVLYLQPKYEIKHNRLVGAEVLVRWNHPEKGMISPGLFIPVFEQNGFILKLDEYVLEHTCMLIKRWIIEGKKPGPLSVNLSRISLYNPKLIDNICNLVKRYDIPPSLLELELTESAFTSDPVVIRDTMETLQKRGFTVLMDDFGSGYSSLNALKDMDLDVLKMDMRFLSKTDHPERSKCIMASVVRMAKWLKMSVTAEGVETKEQLDFLRSIGCEFIQGYYFAKPMQIEEYEKIAFEELPYYRNPELYNTNKDSRAIYAYNEQMDALFGNTLLPVALFEFNSCEEIEIIRVNSAYYDCFGYDDINVKVTDGWFGNSIDKRFREKIVEAFRKIAITGKSTSYEYVRHTDAVTNQWVHADLKYVGSVDDKVIVFATLMDVSAQKSIHEELEKYKDAILPIKDGSKTILIVDDSELNRNILVDIFKEDYNILQAADGVEATQMIVGNTVDMVLLDLVMPKMNGIDLLRNIKNSDRYKDIPVIVISSENDASQQVMAVSLGCSDYVVKPVIPEVLKMRVENAFIGSRAVAIRREHQDYESDKRAVDGRIEQKMANSTSFRALMLIDIDNLRLINDKYGHISGDKAVKLFGDELVKHFRKSDIVERYGGDEFIVFVSDLPGKKELVRRCEELLESIDVVMEDGVRLECSIGVSYTRTLIAFSDLMEKADRALYIAKNRGKNQFVVYDD